MPPTDLDLAAEFCALVEVPDLLAYLGLEDDDRAEVATEALAAKRRYMQAMQANPKFRDASRFLLKHHPALQRVLADPAAHRAFQRRRLEDARLPMLELAIDGILADGVVTAVEEAFVRQSAVSLGISIERYEEVLRARAGAAGVPLPDERAVTRVRPHEDVAGATKEDETSEATIRGADGYGWWDAAFTRLLLDCIPGGPGDLVDVYCRTGLSARTVLPARPQLAWIGVDPSPERLAEAERHLAGFPAHRVQLAQGEPQALPLPDESVDVVLAIRALAHRVDTRPVFDEAWRVLRPGGRLVVAEPDGLAETFYFAGPLLAYGRAFQRLVERVDAALAGRVPATGQGGLALGPAVPHRMRLAGLEPSRRLVHAAHNLRERPFHVLARRLRAYPTAIARAGGLEHGEELRAVLDEVDTLALRIPSDTPGTCGSVLPLFLTVGTKE